MLAGSLLPYLAVLVLFGLIPFVIVGRVRSRARLKSWAEENGLQLRKIDYIGVYSGLRGDLARGGWTDEYAIVVVRAGEDKRARIAMNNFFAWVSGPPTVRWDEPQ